MKWSKKVCYIIMDLPSVVIVSYYYILYFNILSSWNLEQKEIASKITIVIWFLTMKCLILIPGVHVGSCSSQAELSWHVDEATPFNLYPELQVRETLVPSRYLPLVSGVRLTLPFVGVGSSHVASKYLINYYGKIFETFLWNCIQFFNLLHKDVILLSITVYLRTLICYNFLDLVSTVGE